MYAKDGILVLLIYEHIESHHTTSTTIFIKMQINTKLLEN